jgi:putative hydrolase of the HAD superfamily
MSIHCIAFDLDDTLWACQPVIQRAEKILYRYLAEHYPKISRAYSFVALTQQRKYFMQQRPEISHDLSRLRQYWLHDLADTFGYTAQMVENAFHIFWLARNEVQFYDGVLDILDRLSQHFHLGVISNGNADIKQIGVDALFDFSVSASEAGVAKPHADIFKLALDKAQCQANEMIYIGDDPIRDIQGANQAGLHAIWYNPTVLTWQGDDAPQYWLQHHHELEFQIAKLIGDL